MRLLPALVLFAALTLAGCGDPPSPVADPTPTPTTPIPTPPAATPGTATTTPATTTGRPDQIPAGLDRDLRFAGRAFLRLARGIPGAALPVDTPVKVLLGGAEAMTINAADTDDPQVWEHLCGPNGAGYAMRDCPLSALAQLRESGVVFSTQAAQEPCSRPHGLEPQDVGATKGVTLLAPGAGSCFDYAAVELYVNDVAQLVAVNLVLGSP